MEKLFSCFFGSRLYGTHTPTSDIDVKYIVLPDLNSLIIGKQLVNKVKKTNNETNTRNTADDVDEEYIPIQIFARDFLHGQTYALELAFAIEGDHAAQKFHTNLFGSDEEHRWWMATGDAKFQLFYKFVRELRAGFLTSNVKALMGYAVNQASLYSFKGERLNVVREVRAILEMTARAFVNVRLGDCMQEDKQFSEMAMELTQKYPKYFKLEDYDIGGGVMRPCFKLLEKTLPFTDRVDHSVGVVKALESKYGSRADQASESNVDWKATMHAVRIVDEGNGLLEKGHLSFPFDTWYVDHLLSIKRGLVPLDEVRNELNEKLEKLKSLEETTKLPKLTPKLSDEFDTWLANWMRIFYKI